MTRLRKLTLDEIARRNYSEGTTRTHLRIIEDLARYFHRSPANSPRSISVNTRPIFSVIGNSPTTRSIRSSVPCDSCSARS